MRRGLIVEDVPEAQAWLGDALREAFPGIEVTTAGAVEPALAILVDDAFSIALVDLGLPDGSGLDVVRRLNDTCPQTVCVVVTIHADDESLFAALKAGAQGYLLKDREKTQLARRLRGIYEGEPPLSPSIARRLIDHFRPSIQTPEVPLTDREREMLVIIGKGVSVPAAAQMLGISRHTAAGYVKDVYRKLNVSSRAEATLAAHHLGLITS